MKIKTLPLALAALFSSCAYAFDPFVVKDIRVEGIQRTEAGTVFNYLPIRVGDTVTEDSAAQAIKALYATGFFKDVRIEVDGNVLVVSVDERPAIAQVEFAGNKEFDEETLRKGLRDVGIAESRILDRALLEKAEQELKRLYLTRSRYAVQINTTVTPLERNRVAVRFAVEEGEVAEIREIRIVGAKDFEESDLIKLFALRTPGWFTWFTKASQYSKQKLSADLETLKSFYLNRGYLDFTIDSTQVSITPDKESVYISIGIKEGQQYTVGDIKFAGELLVPEAELRELVTLQPGELFARDALTASTKAVSDRLGNDGYAFANVNAAPDVDKEQRKVGFTLFVDPGRRVYVRRINIAGNTKTRDEVVRRELRQFEDAWYDGAKINRSKVRIDRTGFFDEVSVETPPVAGTNDQVDLDVTVKERATGNLLLGAGFSQTEGVVLSGSISQNNLFGSGNALALTVNTGDVNRTVSVSFTRPYYTTDGISRGVDFYHRSVDPTSLDINYNTTSTGAGVRFGVPIREDDSISFGLSIDKTDIETFSDSPQSYQDFVDEFGESNTTLLFNVGWARDGRDSVIYPTRGTYQRVFGEVAIPPADLRYYRIGYQWQRFFPLSKSFTFLINADLAYGDGYGSNPLPFFKNFYAGGIGSVRGFRDSSLGPRVIDEDGEETDDALGGNRRVVGNFELLFPFPGQSQQDRSLRLSAFVDTGQVWGSDEDLTLGDLRVSSGLALSWSSPVGPLRFSVAQPLKKEESDRTQRFQFQLGSTF